MERVSVPFPHYKNDNTVLDTDEDNEVGRTKE